MKLAAPRTSLQRDPASGALLRQTLHATRNMAMCARGYAELIVERPDASDRHAQWAQKIVDQLDRLSGMYAAVEGLRTDLHAPANRFPLQAFLQRVDGLARAELGHEATQVLTRWQIADGAQGFTNSQELERALVPIFRNALEASPMGSVLLIRADLDESGLGWSIEIADRGSGFDVEALERAGEAYFSRKEGHLGLGLFLSGTVLQQQGLSLELTNREGPGALVTVRCPGSVSIRGRDLPALSLGGNP